MYRRAHTDDVCMQPMNKVLREQNMQRGHGTCAWGVLGFMATETGQQATAGVVPGDRGLIFHQKPLEMNKIE